MKNEVNIPDFIQKPRQMITLDKTQLTQRLKDLYNKGLVDGWASGCKVGIGIGLLIAIVLAVTIYKITPALHIDAPTETTSIVAYN